MTAPGSPAKPGSPTQRGTPALAGPGNPALTGPIRRIGVVLRRRSPDAPATINRLVALCEGRDVSLAFESGSAGIPEGATQVDLESEPLDLLLVLGGDGTMLRAARLGMESDIPIFGVNLGRLGFLTTTPESELEAGLSAVLDGKAFLDRRFTLTAMVEKHGEAAAGPFVALNDIVVHQSGVARVAPLSLSVGRPDGPEEIGSFSGDGVIFATPTGSTAYSLSAGGPIVVPDVECMVVTPICPHSLAVRPLVMPANECVMVTALDGGEGVQLTVDGQVERALVSEEVVLVTRGEHEVSLVQLPGQSFLDTVRRKLNWALRAPERS